MKLQICARQAGYEALSEALEGDEGSGTAVGRSGSKLVQRL